MNNTGKLEALDIIDNEINQALSEDNRVAKEMAAALFSVTKSLRLNLKARFGCHWRNSNYNLSYVLEKELKPVLDNIFITKNESASSFLNSIHAYSSPSNIENAIDTISTLCRVANHEDKKALELLSGNLMLLNAHFSPNKKRVKKSDDYPYCKFCYREARLKFDTCHVHLGNNRVDGKIKYERYMVIKKELKKIRQSENISDNFILNKLKPLNMPSWQSDNDALVWIEVFTKKLRLHNGDESEIREFSANLATASKLIFSPLHHSRNWPSAFEGTLLRYEAYELIKFKPPINKDVVIILSKLWGEVPLDKVAYESKLEKVAIKKIRYTWIKKINSMRDLGIADNVIKMVLGFKYMPH